MAEKEDLTNFLTKLNRETPRDLSLKSVLDDKMIEIELRKEEREEDDGFVKLVDISGSSQQYNWVPAVNRETCTIKPAAPEYIWRQNEAQNMSIQYVFSDTLALDALSKPSLTRCASAPAALTRNSEIRMTFSKGTIHSK